MIGGTDIVIPVADDLTALDACVRIVRSYWPRASFEDALTGRKYRRYADVPIGVLRELFAYRDVSAEAAWDAGAPDVAANMMMYLILSDDFVTAVVDDPSTVEMRSILDSIREVLRMDIMSTKAERVLAGAA
jgi:hypothetical protein